ncbi:MAG TPA: UbiD family decarboxylase [Syntrophorhabdales bacterium]|nr:UbiD family decarboxylase [Syntrophorhabdales bacterium]
MNVQYNDLREWLARVEEMGELKRVSGVRLEEDVGRIAELSASTDQGPALMLSGFSGYEQGYSILLNPFGTTRMIAFTFGFPEEKDRLKLLEHFSDRIDKLQLLPPKYVDGGPLLENVATGSKVDLMKFPVPKWHKDDGGPYIGTGCLVITRDPDSGSVNVAPYRSQLHDRKSVGFYSLPGHHGRAHRDKFYGRGEPCPVAMVFGSDPLLFTGGMAELPYGTCEFDWIGGWRGEPLEVIKGPVTGLPIPARAEIAIEGFSYPGRAKYEGPFGEFTGYYASGAQDEPFVDVEAVYHRNDPVLLGMPPMKPPYDADKARQYLQSAILLQQLRRQGIRGISSAWCFGVGGCRFLVVVGIDQQYFGHSRQVGHAAYTTTVANIGGKIVIVVDDDIDVSDLNDVMWAVLTRSDPATSIDIVPRATSWALDPRLSPEDRAARRFFNSRAIIDATKPYEWKDQFPKPVRSDIQYRHETERLFGHLFSTEQAERKSLEGEKT